MERIANILFTISGILWFIQGIPQIIRLLKRKSSDDISLLFFIVCLVALVLFEIGAILMQNLYLFICNFLPLINCIIIIFLVMKYRK